MPIFDTSYYISFMNSVHCKALGRRDDLEKLILVNIMKISLFRRTYSKVRRTSPVLTDWPLITFIAAIFPVTGDVI